MCCLKGDKSIDGQWTRDRRKTTQQTNGFPPKFFDGALGWRRGVWYRGGTRAPSFEDLDATLPLLALFEAQASPQLILFTILNASLHLIKFPLIRNESCGQGRRLNLVQGDRKFCGCQKWFGNRYVLLLTYKLHFLCNGNDVLNIGFFVSITLKIKWCTRRAKKIWNKNSLCKSN